MKKKIAIPSSLKNIKHTVDEVITMLKAIEAEESDIFDIRLSLEEVLINAIRYGNESNEKLSVVIDLTLDGKKVIVTVKDQGRGFDYIHLPDPTREENLLKGRGRGVFLIKHLMDGVEFNKKGNHVTMTKYLKKKDLLKHKREE